MARHGMRDTTIQACLLNIASTLLAQLLKLWRSGVHSTTPSAINPFGIDFYSVLQFLFWCVISTPPNYKWQEFLEQEFPSQRSATPQEKIRGRDEKILEKDSTRLDLGNTAKKFFLDQTLGALVNNAAFVFGITLLRGGSLEMASSAVNSELWSIMSASYKVWPLYSIVSFTIIPPERRIIMGSIAGLFWNIFLVLRVT